MSARRPGERGRALVVTPWFPYPQDNGSRQRLWALIGGLGERYVVDLAALVDQPVGAADVEGARSRCDEVVVVERRPFEPRGIRAIAAYVHPLPRAIVATYTPELRRRIDELVARHPYDIVVVSQLHVARYVAHLRNQSRVLDDFELALTREVSATATGLAGLRKKLNWRKQRRFVRRLGRWFDAMFVVSEEERTIVHDVLPNADVTVVPNGVDLDRNALRDDDAQTDTMIHAGPLAFFANLEGVAWFADEVLPIVRAARPGARLLVTGRTTSVQGPLPHARGVEYTGYLDDIRPAIAQAWLSVVPLHQGGGTRLKVLESLALGTPVVSTTKGVEGLDLVPGRDVLVADTASEFAGTVLALLGDPALRAELRAAGRRAVEERYGWRPIVASFVEHVDALVDARH